MITLQYNGIYTYTHNHICFLLKSEQLQYSYNNSIQRSENRKSMYKKISPSFSINTDTEQLILKNDTFPTETFSSMSNIVPILFVSINYSNYKLINPSFIVKTIIWNCLPWIPDYTYVKFGMCCLSKKSLIYLICL